ncbi:sulfatase [Flavobacterium faecale]|uniref:Sulfatase n=1 Tax=Flavobacterium faecale TaxID=1355330 RepID=A0A2S1LHR9_9FLAO|nr:arylsulfatase [Flavobacterium faecale]AWG23267.1 sulfatase [Flavobacterium faecale]
MKNRFFHTKKIAVVAVLLTASLTFAQSKKPNILVILADDLGYADVGFNGSKDIITPELDKLAKAGTIFSSAYVAHPFCGPSRTALMTGRYPHEIGAPYNLPDVGMNLEDGIPVKENFISNVMHDAGYYTSAIGKWHLGYGSEFQPNNRGFDYFYGFLGGGHKYFPAEYKAQYDAQVKNGNKHIHAYLTPLLHNNTEVEETEYMTDALSREAVRVVKEAKQKQKPFFMYLAYNAPHVPLEAKEEDLKVFANIKDKDRRTYAAMVYAVDRGVGEIVKTLKENKQFDNTLIIFLSDNGGNIEHAANNYPLRGTKGDTYEGGYRVPMFFHWPSVVPAGKRFDYVVSALDFYPTFANLAGGVIPKSKSLDGKDIWANFLAGKDTHKDDLIYAVRYRSGFSDVGARNEDFKIVKAGQNKWKLFDVRKDPSETKDLSAQYPDVLKDMVHRTQKWSESHITPLWYDNKKVEQMWKDTNMPNYDKAFKLDN